MVHGDERVIEVTLVQLRSTQRSPKSGVLECGNQEMCNAKVNTPILLLYISKMPCAKSGYVCVYMAWTVAEVP